MVGIPSKEMVSIQKAADRTGSATEAGVLRVEKKVVLRKAEEHQREQQKEPKKEDRRVLVLPPLDSPHTYFPALWSAEELLLQPEDS